MRVRITAAPLQRDIDGVSLDHMTPGSVHVVSASVGAWLIAQGYGVAEMRRDEQRDELDDELSAVGSHRWESRAHGPDRRKPSTARR